MGSLPLMLVTHLPSSLKIVTISLVELPLLILFKRRDSYLVQSQLTMRTTFGLAALTGLGEF